MPDLFKEILPSILQNKKNVFMDENYSDYNAFIINRALSYHNDCLPYVAELSMLPHLDKDMQYLYLLNSIRPMKRDFKKWQKIEEDKKIENIKKCFGYSNKKAKEVLSILTQKQISEIDEKMDKGGIKK